MKMLAPITFPLKKSNDKVRENLCRLTLKQRITLTVEKVHVWYICWSWMKLKACCLTYISFKIWSSTVKTI